MSNWNIRRPPPLPINLAPPPPPPGGIPRRRWVRNQVRLTPAEMAYYGLTPGYTPHISGLQNPFNVPRQSLFANPPPPYVPSGQNMFTYFE